MKPLAPHSPRLRAGACALAVTALAAGSLALAGGAAQASPAAASGAACSGTSSVTVPDSSHYKFRTLDNWNDPTFNQLLGISDHGKIVGYFGSGAGQHPNKGYALHEPYSQVSYRNQNFPGSVQTQATGLNNGELTVGFYSTMNAADLADNNFGYYATNGADFHEVNYPTSHPASPPVDQLLGVNDADLAVGFYVDSAGNSHGYLYNIKTGKYSLVSPKISGITSVTATGINDAGSVVGFYTSSAGDVRGFFVRKDAPHLYVLSFPGASATQPLGVGLHGEVVGFYTDGSGDCAVTHGFTWTRQFGFHTVDDPHGAGTTTINGVNTAGDLVGFYTGKGGDTNGFLASPRS